MVKLISGEIVPYLGDSSAGDNYNYFSYAGHPVEGPLIEHGKAKFFFYEDSLGLYYLNLIVHKTPGGVEGSWDEFTVHMRIKGNLVDDEIIISDDEGDIEESAPGIYRGHYRYLGRDGAVIGPIDPSKSFPDRLCNIRTNECDGCNFSLSNKR